MDPLTIAAGAQLVGGVVQGVKGLVQKGKARRMARANKRPTYKIQRPVLDNQELIESRAGQGLSDASRRVLEQSNERGLTSSIEAILAGGGSVNNIGDLYGKYSDGISKMALIDEEMRTANVNRLIEQNRALASEQDKAWQVNIWAPYADKAQAAAALTAQGEQNLWKGANSVINAGANWATGQLFKKEANNVYGTGGNLGDQPPAPPATSIPPGLPSPESVSPYNWMFGNNTPPPPRPSIPTPQQQIQQQYPGLMTGNMNGGYDMTFFNDAYNE